MEIAAVNDRKNFDMKEKIREFISSSNFFPQTSVEALKFDTKLVDLGIIESFNVINLILFIESTYGVQMNSSDLLGNNFESINSIEQMIQRKLLEKKKPDEI